MTPTGLYDPVILSPASQEPLAVILIALVSLLAVLRLARYIV